MANYFFLLRKSESNYVALADQDDIWHKDHLAKSVLRISSSIKPALAFSSVNQFSADQNLMETWPPLSARPGFPGAVFENIARGCSFVMNAEARKIINSYEPTQAIMHDWWIYLVILLRGKVEYSSAPELDYRIHSQNFVGVKPRRKFAFLQTLSHGEWAIMYQLDELANCLERVEPSSLTFNIHKLLNNLNGGFLNRLKLATTKRGKYRMHRVDDLIVRIGFIFLPFIIRNMRLHND
jgi:hypothetical protein